MTTKLAAIALITLAAASPALASSDDAWAEFAATVKEKCLAAATDSLENPEVVVDPFGTESYGVAVLTGKPRGAEGTVTHFCVMDKKSQAVELGSELGADVIGVTVPK